MRANDLKERVKKKEKYNSCYQNNKKGSKCSYDEEYTCMVRCHCDEGKAFLKPIFIFQKYKFRVTFINSSRLYKYPHHHHTVIKKKNSRVSIYLLVASFFRWLSTEFAREVTGCELRKRLKVLNIKYIGIFLFPLEFKRKVS